jgi:hypothetical protein
LVGVLQAGNFFGEKQLDLMFLGIFLKVIGRFDQKLLRCLLLDFSKKIGRVLSFPAAVLYRINRLAA